MSRTKPICPHCGSDELCVDAAARWDHRRQEWVVTSEFLDQNHCDGCGEDDVKIEWIEVSARRSTANTLSPVMAGKPWDIKQDQLLVEMVEQGFSIDAMAEALGRTKNGLRARLERHGLIVIDKPLTYGSAAA
jgi:RNA polymerase subunit RPABC4/transcription elongation factor Spt4